MYAWRTGNKNEKYVKRSVEINWDETEEKKKSEKEKIANWIWMKTRSTTSQTVS